MEAQYGQVPPSNASMRSGVTDAIDFQPPRSIFEDDYVVLDQNKVPQNVIENIENRTVKINRKLKKIFTERAKFDEHVAANLTADPHGNVSVDQLRDFVLGLCEKELVAKTLQKRDVEGFLSAFNYNQYGATNIKDVAGLVFTRDDEIPDKLSVRQRPNAPPQDLNKDIDPSSVNESEVHTQRVRTLLNQMEDKVFNGKVKLFQVFRQFDKDKDGYISYEDFHKCL